mmetsp:Transcript_67978/g.141944  ORF Transcript_67978/g.141944 Transcript_67978/m.141944 type:complete len:654 (+) Transcript_67978:104-2065(+)
MDVQRKASNGSNGACVRDWQSPELPLGVRRPWEVFRDLESRLDIVGRSGLRNSPRTARAVARRAANLRRYGAMVAFTKLEQDLQLAYAEVSLSELAAYVAWRKSAAAEEVMRKEANLLCRKRSTELRLQEAWRCLDEEERNVWMPEDNPRAVLADEAWLAPLLQASEGSSAVPVGELPRFWTWTGNGRTSDVEEDEHSHLEGDSEEEAYNTVEVHSQQGGGEQAGEGNLKLPRQRRASKRPQRTVAARRSRSIVSTARPRQSAKRGETKRAAPRQAQGRKRRKPFSKLSSDDDDDDNDDNAQGDEDVDAASSESSSSRDFKVRPTRQARRRPPQHAAAAPQKKKRLPSWSTRSTRASQVGTARRVSPQSRAVEEQHGGDATVVDLLSSDEEIRPQRSSPPKQARCDSPRPTATATIATSPKPRQHPRRSSRLAAQSMRKTKLLEGSTSRRQDECRGRDEEHIERGDEDSDKAETEGRCDDTSAPGKLSDAEEVKASFVKPDAVDLHSNPATPAYCADKVCSVTPRRSLRLAAQKSMASSKSSACATSATSPQSSPKPTRTRSHPLDGQERKLSALSARQDTRGRGPKRDDVLPAEAAKANSGVRQAVDGSMQPLFPSKGECLKALAEQLKEVNAVLHWAEECQAAAVGCHHND